MIAIHSDGIQAAIRMEERRERTTHEFMMKESKYRIKQSVKEQEIRWTIEKERLLGLARRSRKKQATEEKEERMGIQHAWEIEDTRADKRQSVGASRGRNQRNYKYWPQELEGHTMRARNKENESITQADIAETRQFLVPMMELTEVVRTSQSTQFGSKRR